MKYLTCKAQKRGKSRVIIVKLSYYLRLDVPYTSNSPAVASSVLPALVVPPAIGIKTAKVSVIPM
ncbi:TPA: hypothetical protein ACGF19_003000 [Vibrio cholerae]